MIIQSPTLSEKFNMKKHPKNAILLFVRCTNDLPKVGEIYRVYYPDLRGVAEFCSVKNLLQVVFYVDLKASQSQDLEAIITPRRWWCFFFYFCTEKQCGFSKII